MHLEITKTYHVGQRSSDLQIIRALLSEVLSLGQPENISAIPPPLPPPCFISMLCDTEGLWPLAQALKDIPLI